MGRFRRATTTIALAACVTSCGAKTQSHPLGDPILVGVTLGLTNAFETLSPSLRDAIKVAEAQVNAAGGVLGRPIEYRVVDDQSSADGAKARVTELIAAGAVAIIGPLGSGQVPQSNGVAKAANTVQISPTATSIKLNELNGSFLRTTPDDTYQAKAVVRLGRYGPTGISPADAGANWVCSRMHIMFVNNDYGVSMKDSIVESYRVQMQLIPTTTAIEETPKTNYDSDVAAAIFDNPVKPQCMVLILYDDTAAPIILSYDKLRKTRNNPVQYVIGTDGVFTPGFLEKTRLDRQDPLSTVAEGVIGTNPDTNPSTLEFNDFRSLYHAYHNGIDPDAFAANAYDAAVLIALGIAQAGTTDPKSVRDALKPVSAGGRPYGPANVAEALRVLQPKKGVAKEDVDYKGASGDVDFTDATTSVKGAFITWKVSEGKYITVEHVGADKLQ